MHNRFGPGLQAKKVFLPTEIASITLMALNTFIANHLLNGRDFSVNTLTFWRLALRFSRTTCVAFFLAWACTAGALANAGIVLGDYDAEPRIGGHVDTDRLVQRLTDLGANTYMWLIWHNANDWEDLKVFLPKAKQKGITVWVYLVPHSETAVQAKSFPYSEPFRLDYIRWAQEIAKLSLSHSNVAGYVIDDFWKNVRPDRFSPDYIRRMVAGGKAINPKIKFYPLMYFHEIGSRFSDILAPLIDGVIAAYPLDRLEVERALAVMEDRFRLPGVVTVILPANKPSQAGHHGRVAQDAQITDGKNAQLSFHYHHNFDGVTSGYHRLRVLVDDQTVWDEDVAGHKDGKVTIDLAKAVRGKQTVRLSLGIFDVKGVGNFGIEASFSDLSVRGLTLKDVDLGNSAAWSQEVAGPFGVQFQGARVGTNRFRLPLIVMPSGDPATYKLFNKEEGTTANIGAGVKMLTDMAQTGQIEGVVTYCLDKHDGNEVFETVRKVYDSMKIR